MIIKVSEIPEEGLRFEGPQAFPEPFQDRSWRLEDVELGVEKDGDTVFVTGHLRSRVPQVCSRCLGSGKLVTKPCETCDGAGRVAVERRLDVRIPAGMSPATIPSAATSGVPPRRSIPRVRYRRARW